MSNSLNRFLHGTLWKWIPNELVLIISNDEYNCQSTDVNCVSVTKVLGDSISINNVQCNKIYTIDKKALNEFMGAVPMPILAAVKTKIQKQFNMGDDKTLHAVQETATRLIDQLAQLDSEYVQPMDNPTVVVPVSAPLKQNLSDVIDEDATNANVGNIAPNIIVSDQSENKGNVPPTSDLKQKNPVKQAPKSKGKKSKQTARVSLSTGNAKREMRSYTDEDEAFVLDGNHTVEEIMGRFGFTERRKVSDLKFQLKKRRDKRESR